MCIIDSNWNEIFSREAACLTIDKQAEFYTQNVTYVKDQLVIIISDAIRYEVGKSLFEKLQADEKCTATMKAMASTLPSITSYGMAALLPHKSLELSEDYTVLVDGKRSDTLEQRDVYKRQEQVRDKADKQKKKQNARGSLCRKLHKINHFEYRRAIPRG